MTGSEIAFDVVIGLYVGIPIGVWSIDTRLKGEHTFARWVMWIWTALVLLLYAMWALNGSPHGLVRRLVVGVALGAFSGLVLAGALYFADQRKDSGRPDSGSSQQNKGEDNSKVDKASNAGVKAPTLTANIHVVLLPGSSGLRSFYMALTNRNSKQILAPVRLIIHVRIFNAGQTPQKITGIEFAVSGKESGPWTSLIPFDLNTDRIYTVGTSLLMNRAEQKLNITGGMYYFAPPDKKRSFQFMTQMQPTPNLAAVLGEPVAPGKHVDGWMAFGAPDLLPGFFRIQIRDFDGVTSDSISKPLNMEKSESDPDPAIVVAILPSVDLSMVPVQSL